MAYNHVRLSWFKMTRKYQNTEHHNKKAKRKSSTVTK